MKGPLSEPPEVEGPDRSNSDEWHCHNGRCAEGCREQTLEWPLKLSTVILLPCSFLTLSLSLMSMLMREHGVVDAAALFCTSPPVRNKVVFRKSLPQKHDSPPSAEGMMLHRFPIPSAFAYDESLSSRRAVLFSAPTNGDVSDSRKSDGNEKYNDDDDDESKVAFRSQDESGIFGSAQTVTREVLGTKNVNDTPLNEHGNRKEWDVYVCQSKPCLERGAGATLDAFVGLAPFEKVTVHPAILNKAKGKGPNVRCIERGASGRAFEVNNVDSVDKVYRILTRHMNVEGVDSAACECLRWNYRGNEHFEKGELSEAIEAYDKAIATGYADQEGVVLLMRATAYLKRASIHKKKLQEVVSELTRAVPDPFSLQILYGEADMNPPLSNIILQRIMNDCKNQEKKFQQTKYRHGMYQYALLRAAQDSLRATQLLPNYAKTWLRAGEILAELWKLKESAQYYEKAIELDPALADTLTPVIERLKRRQEFLDNARTYGYAEDTLRLALDVAG